MSRTAGEIGIIIVDCYDEVGSRTLTVAEYLSAAADPDEAWAELMLMAAGTIIERDVEGLTHYYHAGETLDAGLIANQPNFNG